MRESEIGLADAGLKLGKSYQQVLRLLLVGSLRGGRSSSGWWVSAEDVDRLAHEQRAARESAVPAA